MTRPLYIYFISQNRSHSAGPVIAIISNHTVLPVRGRSLHGIVHPSHSDVPIRSRSVRGSPYKHTCLDRRT